MRKFIALAIVLLGVLACKIVLPFDEAQQALAAPDVPTVITALASRPVEPVIIKTAVVLAETLRVRETPSVGSNVLTVLAGGDVVTLGQSIVNTQHPDCECWQSIIEPVRGWVCSEWIE